MHYLYWIHFETHTDPFNEGYIGISSQPSIRFRQHTTNLTTRAGSKILKRIVSEFGADSLRHTILGSYNNREDARIEERRYRPETVIGWNILVGGGVNPDCTGRQLSNETKLKISLGNVRTKSSRSYVSPFKGMTNRHSAEARRLIGLHHLGKTISESHKKSASEKNRRENSIHARSIRMRNKETNQTEEFGCIRSASEKLGINYSALRSAIRNNQDTVYRKWEILYQGLG